MNDAGNAKEQARQAPHAIAAGSVGYYVGQQQDHTPYKYMQRDRDFFYGDIFFHLLYG